MIQTEIQDAVFVDVFAGSGSVGIEALSRGAAMVYFVENNRKVLNVLEANLTQLGDEPNWRIYSVNATKALEMLSQNGTEVNILFFDPPYDSDEYPELLDLCAKFFPHATYIVECSRRWKWKAPAEVTLLKSREIGETVLQFYGKSLP